ncbi:MAG: 16S rRNA processing protein RimM [Erysipelotrichaceae bacterium]|jgi:16S rRNA processing protein RimM|nr:ribosome maturation factor RimM [Bacillota bacterium]NLJ32510.1 16S rRNA processing protein RimM [Erysipelotrichaceae bacterium]
MKNNFKTEYIKIGSLIGTRGLKGEFKVYPTTDFLDERFYIGAKVFLLNETNNDIKKVTISSVNQMRTLLVSFKEINTIEEAETFLRYDIVINKNENKLPDGFYYEHDLIGLEVYTIEGDFVGVISEMLEYAPYKTFRVKRENKRDVLIPYVDTFVIKTDIENKRIIINPMEGLL